jgi:tetratricopeptide (TPR) repeat protein
MKSPFLCVCCLGVVGTLTAIAQDPDQGIAEFRKNNFAEAASILRKALESDEGNARANLYLGLALIEQNKAAEAEPFIMKADELSPSGETKMGKARFYVSKRQYDDAEAALQQAEGEDVPYVRGLLELAQKKYADATRDLESYIESHPDHAYAHYYAGMAYNGLKRPDKMLTHFQIFLKMKPNAPEARKVQAVVGTAR